MVAKDWCSRCQKTQNIATAFCVERSPVGIPVSLCAGFQIKVQQGRMAAVVFPL